MKPILIVTPNPSIDSTLVVPNYQLGNIHRPEKVLKLAGGKGLNVARAAQTLGARLELCILVAGHSGRWLVEQLEASSMPIHASWTAGETRTCTSIIDSENQLTTEVYEYGDPIKAEHWQAFETMIDASLPTSSFMSVSGSLPPGAPEDGYARLVTLAHRHGVSALIDTQGKALRQALQAKPFLLKVNQLEAGDLLGTSIRNNADAIEAARVLQTLGAANVILTLGKEGAIAVSQQGSYYAQAPEIKLVSAVGSGDAFLAGVAFVLQNRGSFSEALRLGVAAGAANALNLGPGMLAKANVETLAREVVIQDQI